jgi:hypothetical protein
MTRFLSRCVAVASLVAAVGCASLGSNEQVFITTSQSLVANCQEVGEVAVGTWTREDDVLASLDHAARQKGANYVLLKADGARSGVAYRCAVPSATRTASGS